MVCMQIQNHAHGNDDPQNKVNALGLSAEEHKNVKNSLLNATKNDKLDKYVKMVKMLNLDRKGLIRKLKSPFGGNQKLANDPVGINKIFTLVNEARLKTKREFAENKAIQRVNWTCNYRVGGVARRIKTSRGRMVKLEIPETAYNALKRLFKKVELEKELPTK